VDKEPARSPFYSRGGFYVLLAGARLQLLAPFWGGCPGEFLDGILGGSRFF